MIMPFKYDFDTDDNIYICIEKFCCNPIPK